MFDSMVHMKSAKKTISFDPNLRPTLWKSPEIMREKINRLAFLSNWVLPGIEEGRFLTQEETPEGIASFYRRRGVQIVIIKLGKDGAYYQSDLGQAYVPAFEVSKVIDTVGAGDGFAVGVISAMLEGMSVPAAVKRGAWIGAQAIQVLGDSEGFPSLQKLIEANL
jgi:2-dehydro-3-deoxygluconokinase